MSNFVKPKPRFDMKVATQGIWTYPVDENDTEYGGFKHGLFDMGVPRVKVTLERLNRVAATKSKNKRDTKETYAGIEAFVECALFDWDLNDENGEPIKFTKEAAVEYFTTHEIDEETGEKIFIFDFVFATLMKSAVDVTNFQTPEQNEAGDALGN